MGTSGVASGTYTHKDGGTSGSSNSPQDELGAKVGFREMVSYPGAALSYSNGVLIL